MLLARHSLLDLCRADVRGHDQDGVLEVHCPPLAVGEAAVIEQLKQNVEHVAVCFFDLVEENYRVGLSANRFGELPTLFVADVSGRRADQPRHRMPLHVLGHVDSNQRVLVVEEELRERLGRLGLSDPRRSEEDERTDRSVGILKTGTRPANGIGDGFDRASLANHPLAEPLLHSNQLLHLALEEPGDRDVGPFGDHLRDILGVDLLFEKLLFLLQLGELGVQLRDLLLQGGNDPELQLGGAVQVAGALRRRLLVFRFVELLLDASQLGDRFLLGFPVRLEAGELLVEIRQLALDLRQPLPRMGVAFFFQSFPLDFELDDPPAHLIHLRRHRIDLDPQSRRSLVDQVDRLVGQEPVRDVPVGQRRRGDDRRVLDSDSVVNFVTLLQAPQDADRVFDGRLVHLHRLEAPLQRGVLLDVLPVFVQGRRADAMQLAAGQRRLEHVARVHRPFGLSRPDQGVKLVDEEDDLALCRGNLLEH